MRPRSPFALRPPAARPALDEPPPSESRLIEFPLQDSKPGYAAGMELRMARGAFGDGDVIAWMRMRLPLIGETDPSPLERTLVAADSGNGVSQRVSASEFMFLNADLTVSLTVTVISAEVPATPIVARTKTLAYSAIGANAQIEEIATAPVSADLTVRVAPSTSVGASSELDHGCVGQQPFCKFLHRLYVHRVDEARIGQQCQ